MLFKKSGKAIRNKSIIQRIISGLFFLLITLNSFAALPASYNATKKNRSEDTKAFQINDALNTYYTLLSTTLLLTADTLSAWSLDNKSVTQQYKTLTIEQKNWLKQLSLCQDKTCRENAYTHRLRALKEFARHHRPSDISTFNYEQALSFYNSLQTSIADGSTKALDKSGFLEFPLLISDNQNHLFVVNQTQWKNIFPILFPRSLTKHENWSVQLGLYGNGQLEKAGIVVGTTRKATQTYTFRTGNSTVLSVDALSSDVLTILNKSSESEQAAPSVIGTYINEEGALYVRRTPQNKIAVYLLLLQENTGEFSGFASESSGTVLHVNNSDKDNPCGFILKFDAKYKTAFISDFTCQEGLNVTAERPYLKSNTANPVKQLNEKP